MKTKQPQHKEMLSHLRFTTRAVILTVTVIALCLASYRIGVEHGRELGPMVPTNFSTSKIYTREYDVSDIAKSDDDARLLCDAIRNSVNPTNWAVVGGYAVLHHDPGSKKLDVSHTWPGHVELVRFLEAVREQMGYGGELESILETF